MDCKKKLLGSLLVSLSSVKHDRLLAMGEAPGDFWSAGWDQWRKEAGLTERECALLEKLRTSQSTADRLQEELERKGIRMVTRFDREYPKRLAQLEEKPFALFYLGRLPEEGRASVAVVGARACSEYGRACAQNIAGGLAMAGVQIISGLAYGIDACSQQAAAGYGKTFAVLAGGVDICYPRENRELYERLASEGGVISEMPPGTAGIPKLFPRRNRIISGLADAVIVVEARKKSGSLITAEFAAEQGKLIYAVPGPIDSQLSEGTNELIRSGAMLITDPAQLLEDLRMPVEAALLKENRKKPEKTYRLEPDEADIYSLLSGQPQSMEELLEKSQYPVGTLSEILLRLEVRGCAKRVGMNYFMRAGAD